MNFFGWELIKNDLGSLLTVDWPAVHFKEGHFVWLAVTMLVVAFLLKIGWCWYGGQRAGYYEHSGFSIDQGNKPGGNKPGLGYKILSSISVVFLLGGTGWVFIAMADPYTVHVLETKIEQFQEIAYLKDTSTSTGWRYKGTNFARAEIMQEFLLKLMASRQNKKDRSFYLVFAWKPYLIADFTTDQESLLFSAAIGPLVYTDEDAPKMWPGKFILKPHDDYIPVPFEGGTDLEMGLQAVVKTFDDKGDKKISEAIKKNPNLRRRSVIILTDGASETDPEPQLKELKKRSIVPYLVFLDPDREAEILLHGPNSTQIKVVDSLLRQIKRYGGQSFLATDWDSLDQIREKLDQLYGLNATANASVKTNIFEQHIYRLPLTASLLFLVLGLLTRLIFWKFHQMV
ncbi:MAG: hypothetical protein A3C71_03125 [Candidatus Yanofskybacteria bacterium RIFCSPHIGHO2_02_FULL_43_15c]|uniref:VWFA domain-containing protein n=1 Tax=Candidatus Yanofskybacteria bacterium RIFCSPHIGHO2_02_FULL_43_15c TaxID=1802679 RepID=A0A1F8FGI4_9BACT|nr:MAG: hypothetical protein A3C71_03125 [Candidatus Yanofskybacteria bacterium RIFCSPHIGHO2_02_FULL_43_15c]